VKHKASPENTPKPPPIYINGVKNTSPLIQLLEQIVKQQYKIKALADNYESLSRETHGIPHVQIKRRKKLQSRVKNMHYSINPQEIKTEIEKLGHTVTNIWNINDTELSYPSPCFCRTETYPK
jgi:hypothetical protein